MIKLLFAFFVQAQLLNAPSAFSDGVPASARPDITSIKSNDLDDKFWKDFESGKHPLLEAKLSFLMEIFLFYGDHKVYFLARDCEYLYDLAKLLKSKIPAIKTNIELLHISRNLANDPNLSQYLKQEGVFDQQALLVDQGFEGSIPNRIWSLQKNDSTVRAFFISSVHPEIPSSRYSSRVYLQDFKGDHGEASGQLVEDMEGLPHFFPESSDHLEKVGDVWTAMMPISEEELIASPESEKALKFMQRIADFGRSPRTLEVFQKGFQALNQLLVALQNGIISTELYEKAEKIGGLEFFQDLRELYWKGHLKIDSAAMQEFWMRTRGSAPELADTYDDYIVNSLDKYKEAKNFLSKDKNFDASAKRVVDALKNDSILGLTWLQIALKIDLPPLWSALMENLSDLKLTDQVLQVIFESPHLEEFYGDHLKKIIFQSYKNQKDIVEKIIDRLRKVPSNKESLIFKSDLTASVQVNFDSLTNFRKQRKENARKASFANIFEQTFTFNGSKRMQVRINGKIVPLMKKLGEGYHSEVYAVDEDTVVKIPHDAEDSPSLEVELMVYQDLKDRFKRIKILPILDSHPEGLYIVKPLLQSNLLGDKIFESQNGQLNEDQSLKLRSLFDVARAYALETGIGLDLKADNLAWIEGDWWLIEAGPRFSHVPYGYTLEPENFEAYLKIWMLSDLPGPAKLSYEEVKKMQVTKLTSKIDVTSWPSFVSPIKQIESMIDLVEFEDAPIMHDMRYFDIAMKSKRIFLNDNLSNLPQGLYTFVLLGNGEFIFGKDVEGIEIGIKHFQLAQGKAVVAAGEYSTEGAFSLQSGSFSRELLKNRNYREDDTATKIQVILSDLMKRQIVYSKGKHFIQKPQRISATALIKYCMDEIFFTLHKSTICRDFPNPCKKIHALQ